MAEPLQKTISSGSRPEGVATTISDRLSQELVVAFVGSVASGVSAAANFTRDILEQDFSYEVAPIIKPSDIIRAEAHRVGLAPPSRSYRANYIDTMQSAGNELRAKFGPNYLVEKAIERIVAFRTDKQGYADVNGQRIPLPGRRAYIIDSIKDIEELDLLRQIYGDTLCLIGVFAPDAIRRERLASSGVETAEIQKKLDRDQGEIITLGQMTRNIFIESDFFICNDRKIEALKAGIFRYLVIIFDSAIHTPTRAESAMYEANAAASNSACMSRQVAPP
jgi:dephospho-CoA kinase